MDVGIELRPSSSPTTKASRTPLKTVSFPPSGVIRILRNIVIVLAVLVFLLKALTTGLDFAGITTTGTLSLGKHQGSVPTIPATPSSIDMHGVYIRATRLQDGSLLAGYTRSTKKDKILLTARSTDDGQTWSPHGEVFRGGKATHDCDNAFVMQLPSGRILYAYRNHQRNENKKRWYKFFRISISYSDDNGVTFKYLSTVDERRMNGINGLWEPFMRLDSKGSIQCYYSAENGPPDQDGLMRISHDGGETWGDRIVISGTDIRSRDGMIGCASTGNVSDLICVFENTMSGHFTVDAVFSHDDGLTWGERRRMYTPRNGTGCDGRPIIAGAPQIYNVGGTLVLSFMTNESFDNCHGYNGGELKVITSTDGGNTWSQSYTVGHAPAHWGGLFDLNETHFLALYSRDGYGALSQTVLLS